MVDTKKVVKLRVALRIGALQTYIAVKSCNAAESESGGTRSRHEPTTRRSSERTVSSKYIDFSGKELEFSFKDPFYFQNDE
jgi:hypothetical protein